jgi:hypothetical protein
MIDVGNDGKIADVCAIHADGVAFILAFGACGVYVQGCSR